MSRLSRRDDSAPSYDSFLDIVANLVGILVILIMVIGVRAQNAWTESRHAPPIDSSLPVDPLPDIESPRNEMVNLQAELDALKGHLQSVDGQIAHGQLQQQRLQHELTLAGRAVSEKEARLNADQQDTRTLQSRLRESTDNFIYWQQKQEQIEKELEAPIVVRHYPTPLAQTVFGREEHFRLLAGRLAYVPLNALTEQLKNEARLKAWKLKTSPTTTESIGPVDGFRLRYTLRRRDEIIQTPSGSVRRRGIGLDHFVLLPTSEELGEPLDQAMQPGATLDGRLAAIEPGDMTITVWTYPDSFKEFRELRDHLRDRGYATAARPLPHGHPIGGSPHGSRSAAQ